MDSFDSNNSNSTIYDKVYAHIKANPNCSNLDVKDALKLSGEETDKLIDDLKRDGDITEFKPDQLVVLE